jgi:hypothetical protein
MFRRVLLYAVFSVASASCVTPAPPREARQPPTIQLTPCRVPRSSESVRCGTYDVFEERVARIGRRVALNIVVLAALDAWWRNRGL